MRLLAKTLHVEHTTTKIQLIRMPSHMHDSMTWLSTNTATMANNFLAIHTQTHTKNIEIKCAMHASRANSLAYVGTKQIEKLEAFGWQRSSFCAGFYDREVRSICEYVLKLQPLLDIIGALCSLQCIRIHLIYPYLLLQCTYQY